MIADAFLWNVVIAFARESHHSLDKGEKRVMSYTRLDRTGASEIHSSQLSGDTLRVITAGGRCLTRFFSLAKADLKRCEIATAHRACPCTPALPY